MKKSLSYVTPASESCYPHPLPWQYQLVQYQLDSTVLLYLVCFIYVFIYPPIMKNKTKKHKNKQNKTHHSDHILGKVDKYQ